MEYGKILEIKKAIKTLIDLLNLNGETRIAITKSELEEYLKAIETLESTNRDVVECLKKRIEDDTRAGADSSEYLETTIYEVIEEVFGVNFVALDDKITVMVLNEPEYFKLFNEYPEDFKEEFPHTKYEFKTPKEFVEHWYDFPEGNWYWAYHGKYLMCSGAIDPNDTEIFEEYFENAFDDDIDLPESVTITTSELAVDTDSVYENRDKLCDVVGNYLNDTYGFYSLSYNIRIVYNENNEPSGIIVTNIKWDTTE